MKEYINPNPHAVHLTGPDGRVTIVNGGQRIRLDDYFERYRSRGFIQLAGSQARTQLRARKIVQARLQLTKKPLVQTPKPIISETKTPALKPILRNKTQRTAAIRKIVRRTALQRRATTAESKRPVVGKRTLIDATELLRQNLNNRCYPISNNIGVGILSYNRGQSLSRLMDSIAKNTDLRNTTVFISDDGSTDQYTLDYLKQLEATPAVVVLRNQTNIGVAGNSNRLLRCLSRFEHGLILNDDVEVLQPGWDTFYATAAAKSGLHHFQHREIGVYGAEFGSEIEKDGVHLRVVRDKPHGAVLAFTKTMLDKCGFFDEDYGKYGMEHVDWSMKPYDFGVQASGFFDVVGSETFFKVYNENSSVSNRSELLKVARQRFDRRVPVFVRPTERSKVPEVTYVVPFRNINRQDSIITVVNGLRAQRYPVIHIIIVEQDTVTKINLEKFAPVNYYLAAENDNLLFNKAKAFNLGVSHAPSDIVILHDADMLVRNDYTAAICEILKTSDSCHLGGTVIYTTEESAAKINSTAIVSDDIACERVVGYYEGGSLACKVSAYWRVGGFNEDYWGYGCEDCDFYARLSQASKWLEQRTFDLVHLWHDRVLGWDKHHKENKNLERLLSGNDIQARVRLQHAQLNRLGYGDELAKSNAK